MNNEIERRQMILQKIGKVCKHIQVSVICLGGVLIFMELFDVRIDFGSSHSMKLAVFILITGLFMLSLTAWFTLCSVFVLGILKPFGVQIVNYNSLFALFLDFLDMAWIAFVSSSICSILIKRFLYQEQTKPR